MVFLQSLVVDPAQKGASMEQNQIVRMSLRGRAEGRTAEAINYKWVGDTNNWICSSRRLTQAVFRDYWQRRRRVPRQQQHQQQYGCLATHTTQRKEI